MMVMAIWLGIIAGILNALTKISDTREGKAQAAKEYDNFIDYMLRK